MGLLYIVFENDDAIIWKRFLYYWLFVRRIHRLLVNYSHKGPVMGSFDMLLAELLVIWDALTLPRDLIVYILFYVRRYGDKAPRSVLGRIWGVVWILVGINLMSFLFSLMTSTLRAELDASSGIRGVKVNHELIVVSK